MSVKKLITVDDYREAWRLQDAGNGWITYRNEVDLYCPSDVIGFKRDLMDGGVGGLSETEKRLAGFLFELQPNRKRPDLGDTYEYARRKGYGIVGNPDELPVSRMTRDILDHEHYLLKDSDTGRLWQHLRKHARFEYALLVYSLYRQRWAAKWVRLANQILVELDKHNLDFSSLRTVRRVDPLSIERAREFKLAANRVPKRLRRTLKRLEAITAEDTPLSTTIRAELEKHLEVYKSFVKDYRQHRRRRFETLSEYYFQAIAGRLKGLLDERRGRPSLSNLGRRASKAVFVELADELIEMHSVSMRKATLLAGQITCLLFPKERVKKGTGAFDGTYAKKVLDEYKYAKESLNSV
jgi:hypothetical protein